METGPKDRAGKNDSEEDVAKMMRSEVFEMSAWKLLGIFLRPVNLLIKYLPFHSEYQFAFFSGNRFAGN